MNFKIIIGTLVLLSLSTVSFAADQVLRVHGSNTVGATLMPALVTSWLEEKGYAIRSNRFTAENERVINAEKGAELLSVEIHAHGSSTGFKSLQAEAADMSMSSRPVKQKEVHALRHMGDLSSTEKEIVVGVDGIAVVVHPSNAVSSLSMQQLKQVFSGEITNWSQLGGVNQTIQVYARDNASGTYDTFKSLVLGKKKPLVTTAKRYESNDALSDDVSQDTSGIGFVGLPSIRNAKALAIADGDNVAILPSELSVATEDYPLSRRLYVYAPYGNKKPLANSLSHFIKTQVGQKVVAQVGFISQNINAYDIPMGENYPADYRDLLAGANRLSLNFRFRPGAYRLDNKALQDIDRLAAFLKKHKIEQVILAGFSDGAESAPWRRQVLSTERGDFVAESLIKRGIVPTAVRGFGSEVQVASNGSVKGRDKNRRVEVWVKHESFRASIEKSKRLTGEVDKEALDHAS